MDILNIIRKNQKLSILIVSVLAFIVLFIISFVIASNAQKIVLAEKEVANQQAAAERSTLYYYEIENEARYTAYSEANPDIAWDDVVWHVNVQLDKEPYEDPVTITDVDAIPVLVNKHYMFPADYVPQNLVETRDGKQLRKDVYDAYNKMRDAIHEEKLELSITSGYRSIEDQESLYNYYVNQANGDVAKVDSESSRAGFSEHHSGATIDLIAPNFDMEEFGKSLESEWVDANAHLYGFIIRYTEENKAITGYEAEPWHITYVGVDVATYMVENNILTLEEYYAKFIQHHPSEAEEETAEE